MARQRNPSARDRTKAAARAKRRGAAGQHNGVVTLLTEEQIQTLPVRELALALLQRMEGRGSVDFVGFLQGIVQALPARPGLAQPIHGRSLHGEPTLAYRLAEAWDWLYINGLTACDPIQGRTFRFVTEHGKAALAEPHRLP